jgi:hypothetical protein
MNIFLAISLLAPGAISPTPVRPDTTASFTLPSGVQVRIVEAPFEASLFKVVGCSTGESRCLINGQVPFGSGNGLPRTYIKSITVSFKGRSYLLDSSQMFNAWGSRPLAYPPPRAVRYFGGNCFDSANCQFRGVFSDAGGSFAAEWVIVGGAVVRTILTDRNDVVGFIMNNIDPPELE